MNDPIFLSLPIYPPILPSEPSLSTNLDHHLIPHLSHDRFPFQAQLTSLYLHLTDYTYRLYDKNHDFFTTNASKIMSPYQCWLDNGVNIFSLQFKFFRQSIYDLKRMKVIFHSSLCHKKSLTIKHTQNFFIIPNDRTSFLQNTSTLQHSQ